MRGNIKINKQKNQDLLDFLGSYLFDISKTVTKIKDHVYSFLNISITVSQHKKDFSSTSSLSAGLKQNLDDLRRIQSLLRGYMNSKRQCLKQENQIKQLDKSSLKTMPSQTDLNRILGHQNNSYIQQILEVKAINYEYKEQINKLRQQIFLLKSNRNKEIQSTTQNIQSFKNLENFTHEKNSSKLSDKKKVIKRCKSQLIDTNVNLQSIRKRNRQCLDMVKLLKQQLDIMNNDGEN